MRFSPFPLAPAPQISSKHIVYHLDIVLDRDKLVIIRSVGRLMSTSFTPIGYFTHLPSQSQVA